MMLESPWLFSPLQRDANEQIEPWNEDCVIPVGLRSLISGLWKHLDKQLQSDLKLHTVDENQAFLCSCLFSLMIQVRSSNLRCSVHFSHPGSESLRHRPVCVVSTAVLFSLLTEDALSLQAVHTMSHEGSMRA